MVIVIITIIYLKLTISTIPVAVILDRHNIEFYKNQIIMYIGKTFFTQLRLQTRR